MVLEFILNVKKMFVASSLKELRKADIMLTRHDADCGYIYNNQVYSPLIDSVAELCSENNYKALSVSTPYSKFYGKAAYNNPLVFNLYFSKIALIGIVLRLFRGAEFSYNWKYNKRVELWFKILDCIQPRMIIGIQPEPSLCEAAKRACIEVFDLQHGVVAINDWPYAKSVANNLITHMPTGFLCWDQQNAEEVAPWAQSNSANVNVTGHPWFERFKVQNENDDLVRNAMRLVAQKKTTKLQVLVSLQWGLHIHYYKGTDFNKVMCKALENVILETGDYIDWNLRLHPVQLRGQEGAECLRYLQDTFGMCSWVEWNKTSRTALPIVLKQSDLHITDMSSVVIEASWFNIPTALLNPFIKVGEKLEGLYSAQIESGNASLVEQSEEAIKNWIELKSKEARTKTALGLPCNSFEAWLIRKMQQDMC